MLDAATHAQNRAAPTPPSGYSTAALRASRMLASSVPPGRYSTVRWTSRKKMWNPTTLTPLLPGPTWPDGRGQPVQAADQTPDLLRVLGPDHPTPSPPAPRPVAK